MRDQTPASYSTGRLQRRRWLITLGQSNSKMG